MERKSAKIKENADKNPQKKWKRIVSGVVTAVLSVAFAVVFITFIVIMVQVGQGKAPSLFNRRFYYIVTDSMTPGINVGDVILSKTVTKDDTELFVEGAVITYTAESGPMKGREVTHRIVEGVHFDETLNDYVVLTKGDKAGAKIDDPVRLSTINAVMIKKTVFVGWLIGVFKSGAGFALIFAIPLGIILICLVVKLITAIKTPAVEKNERTDEELKKQTVEEIKKKAIEEYIKNHPDE